MLKLVRGIVGSSDVNDVSKRGFPKQLLSRLALADQSVHSGYIAALAAVSASAQ